MIVSKFDVISELFLAFNKDPHRYQNQIEFYIKKLSDLELDRLAVICKEMHTAATFPRYTEIMKAYKNKYANMHDKEYLDKCMKCNSIGLIYDIKYADGDGSSYLYSVEQDLKGKRVNTFVIGKCKCEAGEQFKSYPEKDVPGYIQRYADEQGLDCSFAAQDIVNVIMRRNHDGR